MKKALFLCALGTALLGSQVAKADTFSLAFAGSLGGQSVSNGTSGSGTDIFFTTNGTPTPGTFFNPTETPITGITGTVVIGGHTYDIGALDNGLGGSNELADNFAGVLSPNGLDFDLTTVGNPNPDYTQLMLNYNTVSGAYDLSFKCGRSECTATGDSIGLEIYDVDSAPAATPEPGSLALLGTSILGGAGLLRRRFKV